MNRDGSERETGEKERGREMGMRVVRGKRGTGRREGGCYMLTTSSNSTREVE